MNLFISIIALWEWVSNRRRIRQHFQPSCEPVSCDMIIPWTIKHFLTFSS